MPKRPRLQTLVRLARAWRRDTRGTSMVTTAVTLPLLLVIVFGIWAVFMVLVVRWNLHLGVHDAARYITECARYWNLDPQSGVSGLGPADYCNSGDLDEILPADYYDREAKRMIVTRLRDLIFYPEAMITDSLTVVVTEPALAFAPGGSQTPIDVGLIHDGLCKPREDEIGEFRAPENIRFLIRTDFEMPLFRPVIPYVGTIKITLHERATGYVECPRWRGQKSAIDPDKSMRIGSEAPYLGFRFRATPGYPTVTPAPPTEVPTQGPSPTPPATPTITLTPAPTNTPVFGR